MSMKELLIAQFVEASAKLKNKLFVKQYSEINKGELNLLMILYAQGKKSPSELMELTHHSSAHVAKTICQLKLKGQVDRFVDKGDKRKAYVTLTEEGKNRVEGIKQEFENMMNKAFDCLGQDDSEALIRILNKLASM